jgi:predicted dehydrogenase
MRMLALCKIRISSILSHCQTTVKNQLASGGGFSLGRRLQKCSGPGPSSGPRWRAIVRRRDFCHKRESMSKAEAVRIGIIGLGWPGQRHSEAVLATPGAVIHAGVDANEERRKDWGKLYPQAQLYSDYNDMLLDPEIHAVVVCLPNFLHFPATIAALRAGKHVMCEKPPTLNRVEMRKIRDEAAQRNLVYAFGRQMRFNGRMRVAREMVASGRMGKIYFTRTQWVRSRGTPVGVGGWFVDRNKAGGGAMIDIGIHALDAAWYLMGCPRPKTVSASVSTNFRRLVSAEIPFDVDDCGFAFIRFDNGAVMHLEVSWSANLPDDIPEKAPGKRELHNTVLYGQKASLRVEPLTLFEDQGGKLVDIPMEAQPGNGFAEQMQDFVQAVSTGGTPVNDSRQALYLMEMLDAIYESSATGREVLIPD